MFSGLSVMRDEKLCRTWMNQRPVLFLSLRKVDRHIRAGIHADRNADEFIYDRGNRRLPSGGQDAGGIDHDGAPQEH